MGTSKRCRSPAPPVGVTIVGVKRSGHDFTHATAETVVEDGDLIIVSGSQDRVERFSELT